LRFALLKPAKASCHLRDELPLALQGGAPRREPLEHLAHLDQLEKLAQGRNRQVDSPARLDVDDAFLLELVEREAQRASC